MKERGQWLSLLVAFALGVAVGAVAIVGMRSSASAQVRVLEGYASVVNESKTAMGFTQGQAGGGESYTVAGAMWRERDGPWQSWSEANCLEPGAAEQQVRIGVVTVAPTGTAPGRTMVVWLECLD